MKKYKLDLKPRREEKGITNDGFSYRLERKTKNAIDKFQV